MPDTLEAMIEGDDKEGFKKWMEIKKKEAKDSEKRKEIQKLEKNDSEKLGKPQRLPEPK